MGIDEVWVVIPAFNEARVIERVVSGVIGMCPNVVVVDDCSTDGTFEIVARTGAHVLRHPVNLGQGAALQTGMTYAVERGARYVATFDADGQHDIADLAGMYALQRATGVDCVLGSRFLGNAAGVPLHRRLLLKAAVCYTRWTSGLAVTDAHNGFRLFARAAATRLHLRQNRMAHASELLEQIRARRITWAEAPVTVRYTDYSLAKGQRSRAAVRILMELLVGRLSR